MTLINGFEVIDISSTSADKLNKSVRPLAYALASSYVIITINKRILQ
jgi:hypothetical protein